jgi:hypothetical protein
MSPEPAVPEGRLITFYRADDERLRPLLVRGGLSLAAGAAITLLCALTERLHLDPGLRVVLSVLGCSLLVFGLVSGFFMLPKLLRDDRYISARTDGLLVCNGDSQELVAWDSVARVTAKAGELVLELREADSRVLQTRFGGKTPELLAAELETIRRKASMNLL